MIKAKLPKSITPYNDKYKVVVYSRAKKTYLYVGLYEDLSEATEARDNFICLNYDKLGFYIPRGIHKQDNGRYSANLSVGGNKYHIGVYDTLEEAVYSRRKVILSLL